jgi:hypothetical protein
LQGLLLVGNLGLDAEASYDEDVDMGHVLYPRCVPMPAPVALPLLLVRRAYEAAAATPQVEAAATHLRATARIALPCIAHQLCTP